MAQFRATIKGTKGEASRLGHKNTGICAQVNGWTSGITVFASHHDGVDVFEVWQTEGSARGGEKRMIAQVHGKELVWGGK